MSSRVRYREAQVLLAEDLEREQAYRILQRRRHNLAMHGWGIVEGLGLVGTQEALEVGPGFAIDGFGRELVVPAPLRMDAEVLESFIISSAESVLFSVDCYLCWRARSAEQKIDCNGTAHAGRLTEQAWLKLECVTPDEPPIDPNQTTSTVTGVRQDETDEEWPVYLGRASGALAGSTLYVYVTGRRRYSSSVAAHVAAPWSRTPWLSLSSSESEPDRRFAVTLTGTDGKSVDRWRMNRSGDTRIQGSMRTSKTAHPCGAENGSVLLQPSTGDGAEVRRNVGLEFDGRVPMPESAHSWRSYRVREGDRKPEQWRVELDDPGQDGEPSRQRLVVGEWGGTNGVAMVVRADNKVVVRGDLLLGGQLIQGPIPADPDNPRFKDELLTRWTNGLTTAGGEVDAFYRPAVEIEAPETTPAPLVFSVKVTNNQRRPFFIQSARYELLDTNNRPVHQGTIPLGTTEERYVYFVDATSDTHERILPVPGFVVPAGVYSLIVRVRVTGGAQAVLEQVASKLVQVT